MAYGQELILDLHACNVTTFSRESIANFMVSLCEEIDMERQDLHFWDDEGVPDDEKQTDPKTTGISAVQFILTSSVVIHTLTKLRSVYLNVFSCKAFDNKVVERLARAWFRAKWFEFTCVERT